MEEEHLILRFELSLRSFLYEEIPFYKQFEAELYNIVPKTSFKDHKFELQEAVNL